MGQNTRRPAIRRQEPANGRSPDLRRDSALAASASTSRFLSHGIKRQLIIEKLCCGEALAVAEAPLVQHFRYVLEEEETRSSRDPGAAQATARAPCSCVGVNSAAKSVAG